MKAVVLDADWAPRGDLKLTPEQIAARWTINANLTWQHPRVRIEERPVPGAPSPDEVVLQVGACGICGSDVHMFETDKDGYIFIPYRLALPVVAGHEFSGKVVEVGKDVRNIRKGDLVAVEEIQWCGACRACRGGFLNQCDNIQDLGFTVDGGYQEYTTVKAKYCWSLSRVAERLGSEELALEAGALCEPTSVSYEGMFTRAGGIKPGSTVAVFGGGPIGLAAVALASAAGASQVFSLERMPGRMALAREMGATMTLDPVTDDAVAAIMDATDGAGVDMMVETTGNFQPVLNTCQQILGVASKVVIVGMEPTHPNIDLLQFQLRGASLYGTVGHSGGWDFPNVIRLMASGKIDMRKAVTKRVGLEGLLGAIDDTKKRLEGKILVKPSLG
ncbi:MAG: scyllo-inosose 3-dehydrogenase [Chloroflexota bacterium]